MPMQHAVDRSQSEISPVLGPAPGVARSRRGRLGTVAIGILIATLAGSGCRSGVRSMTAPKWPSFGSSKPKGVDDSGLTAAPKVAASINKPSTAATPYPTTSTPAGYVVNDASPTAGGPVPGIQTAATDPGSVTYGVTPPAQVAPPAAESPAAVAGTVPPAAVATQVGPYATLPPPPPAAESPTPPGIPPSDPGLESALPSSPQVAAAPPGGGYPVAPPAAASAFPSTAGYEPSRVADARGGFAPEGAAVAGAAAATPALVPITSQNTPPPDVGGTQARYASDRSRFGDPLAPPADVPPASAAALAPPAAAVWTGANDASAPVVAPPASFPAAPPAPLAPAPLAPANPDGLTSPPVRRPDPVFRPGGTSSYRPAEQIFVDEQPVAPSAVRTASYEFAVPPSPPVQD